MLRSYAYIVENVKDKIKTMSLKDAIHTTIDECISKGILSDFLSKNRRKVEKVMNLDFTFERQIELTRKEERELGRTEGREEGRIESVLSLLRKGKITLSEAAEEIGTDEDKVKELLGN